MATPTPDDALLGRWLLDHREPDGAAVYLSYDSFSGRPSRAPRPGIDLRADGTFAWLAGGAADGHVGTAGGRWQRSGPVAIELHPDDGPTLRATLDDSEPRSLRVET
jgi:hypothetical protein